MAYQFEFHQLTKSIAELRFWLCAREKKLLIESIVELEPFPSQVEALYDLAIRTTRSAEALPDPLKKMLQKAEHLDTLYDRKLNGICGVIDAIMTTTEKQDLFNSLDKLKKTLFPEGILGTTHSYLRQAGYVVVADMKITLEMVTILQSIRYDDHSLFDDYTEWVSIGKSLGELETYWERMIETLEDVTLSPTDIRNLKVRWYALCDRVSDIVKLSYVIDDDTRSHLLTIIQNAGTRHELQNRWPEEENQWPEEENITTRASNLN